jgi:hypothetical protein
MRRAVPVINMEDGIRAVQGGKPINPDRVRRYLASKFGENLGAARSAMQKSPKLTSRENSPAVPTRCTSASVPPFREVCGDGAPTASWI